MSNTCSNCRITIKPKQGEYLDELDEWVCERCYLEWRGWADYKKGKIIAIKVKDLPE